MAQTTSAWASKSSVCLRWTWNKLRSLFSDRPYSGSFEIGSKVQSRIGLATHSQPAPRREALWRWDMPTITSESPLYSTPFLLVKLIKFMFNTNANICTYLENLGHVSWRDHYDATVGFPQDYFLVDLKMCAVSLVYQHGGATHGFNAGFQQWFLDTLSYFRWWILNGMNIPSYLHWFLINKLNDIA